MSNVTNPKHPFNAIIKDVFEALEITDVSARVIIITGNLAKYNYIEFISDTPKLSQAVSDMLVTMYKSYNGNKNVNPQKDDQTGYPRFEITDYNEVIGQNLIGLAEEIRMRAAFPSFKEAFDKLGDLATGRTYSAKTGYVLLISPVVKDDSHGSFYGFKIQTNDPRIINAARKLEGLAIEPGEDDATQISSHNGFNNQMSQLFDQIKEFGTVKPRLTSAYRA